MSETPDERARRLGLTAESPDVRARRLGLMDPPTGPITSGHSKFTPVQLVSRANRSVAASAQGEENTYSQKALGGISALMPSPLRAPVAGVRAVVKNQPYREALSDIEGAQASNPIASGANRFVGNTVGMLSLPGSLAAQGAAYGVAEGLTDPNPDASLKDRAWSGTWRGALGGALGKVASTASTASRVSRAVPLDEAALAREDAMRAADHINYGKVGSGTSPAIQAALQEPDIAPVADMLRNSRQFRSADDATILQESYKHLSEAQGSATQRITNAPDNAFRAGSRFENREIGLAKEQLLQAGETPGPLGAARTPPITPQLRPAIESHAAARGEQDAAYRAARSAKNIIRDQPGNLKKLTTESPAAFRRSIPSMSEGEATEATQALLGASKGNLYKASINPAKAVRGVARTTRLGSVLEQLDQAAMPNDVLGALRARGLRGVSGEINKGGIPEALRAALPSLGLSYP